MKFIHIDTKLLWSIEKTETGYIAKCPRLGLEVGSKDYSLLVAMMDDSVATFFKKMYRDKEDINSFCFKNHISIRTEETLATVAPVSNSPYPILLE